MKQIVLSVPNNKFNFFMKLINGLGYVKVTDDITENHKEIIRSRIKTSKSEDLIDWAKAKKSFKFD